MADGGFVITGIDDLIADTRQMSGDVDDELADQLGLFVEYEEDRMRARAARVDAQARLAARSVTADRSRAGGQVRAGGSEPLPGGHGTYGDLFFGAEFGGGSRPQTRQFRPYKPQGYWFFQTLEDDDDKLMDGLEQVLDVAARRWAG